MNLHLKVVVLTSTLTIFSTLNADTDSSREAILERIKPSAKVCLESDSICDNGVIAQLEEPARTGEEIYITKCSLCHSVGVSGAPKFGTTDWQRMNDKGIEHLLATAISGINGMPAKGLCSDCSDTELKNAIQFMIDSIP